MAKLAEGRLVSPVSLASRMRLAAAPAPIEALRGSRCRPVEVGDEDLVAVALDVGEAELGPGMGQLAPGDHARALPPARQVHQVGDLGHLAGVAFLGPVGRNGPLPALLGHDGHHRGQLGVQLEADDEAHASLSAGLRQAV